ncbi:MAG: hypothetical protein ACQEXJ_21605 [Myxococcota bacterium]
MVEAVVAAAELSEALGRVVELASGAAREVAGTWQLGPGGLRLAWGGVVQALDAEVTGEACVRVTGAAMEALAGACDDQGEVAVRVEAGRLQVGSFTVSSWKATPEVLDLVPVDASPRDGMLAAYRIGGAELGAAGIDGVVGSVADRAHESIREAAETLSWLGVDEVAVAGWLDDRLAREATGGRSASSDPEPVRRVLMREQR